MPAFDTGFNAALAHALTDPRIAAALALAALKVAIGARRPDLAYRANSLLGALR